MSSLAALDWGAFLRDLAAPVAVLVAVTVLLWRALRKLSAALETAHEARIADLVGQRDHYQARCDLAEDRASELSRELIDELRARQALPKTE
jgi:hypothetical protein